MLRQCLVQALKLPRSILAWVSALNGLHIAIARDHFICDKNKIRTVPIRLVKVYNWFGLLRSKMKTGLIIYICRENIVREVNWMSRLLKLKPVNIFLVNHLWATAHCQNQIWAFICFEKNMYWAFFFHHKTNCTAIK